MFKLYSLCDNVMTNNEVILLWCNLKICYFHILNCFHNKDNILKHKLVYIRIYNST